MNTKKTAIIFDLDGTIANIDHRVHHVKDGSPKDYPAFFEAMDKDTPNTWCTVIMNRFNMNGFTIIICTGRPDTYRQQTVDWLLKNRIPFDEVLMRKESDFRKDSIVKKEIYEQDIKPEYKTLFVVDDRMQVVKMWRELGLTCLQCAEGNY